MKHNFPKILLFLFVAFITLIIEDYYRLGVFYFYFLIAYLLLEILINKKLKLIYIWNVSFIFTILSEVFLAPNSSTYSNLFALKFLVIANNIVNIGHLSKGVTIFKEINKRIYLRRKNFGIIFLLATIIFYIGYNFQGMMLISQLGRSKVDSVYEGSASMFGTIFQSLALILPAVLGFYFIYSRKKGILIPFLLALPIFILLFLGGSRFPLLFSVLGFVFVTQNKILFKLKLKSYFIAGISALLLISGGSLMKVLRTTTYSNGITISFKENSYKDFPTYTAQFMSNEGVIDMTSLLISHFDTEQHTYGLTSIFPLYFWIPRSIWPNKPTMLGHWFVRIYRSGFSSGHSASFGFTGELFADFGFFSLLFVFYLGRLVKIMDDYALVIFNEQGFRMTIVALFYPFIFFFVRSPITATTSLLGAIIFYLMFKRVLYK